MPSFRNSTLGWCLSSFALCLPPAVARAQTVSPTPPPADTSHGRSDAIRAFLDCQGETSLGCSSEFFVLELPYVTWTRDRLFADVQFLVTTIRTGSGAFQYTVTALGADLLKRLNELQAFAGKWAASQTKVSAIKKK